jgi:hypothetical protein
MHGGGGRGEKSVSPSMSKLGGGITEIQGRDIPIVKLYS